MKKNICLINMRAPRTEILHRNNNNTKQTRLKTKNEIVSTLIQIFGLGQRML